MRHVKIFFSLIVFSFAACAKDIGSDEYLAYNAKISLCLSSSEREVSSFKDDYYNSLSDIQRKALLLSLSSISMNKCYSYEENSYLKHLLLTDDNEGLNEFKRLNKPAYRTEEMIKAYNSLDQNEIKRLSNTKMFSTPFDIFSVIN
ncbi:hypothetical protein BTO22_13635 [Aliivibrio sifiae]|uniref:Lipoprotein n=1 Tax=Aliivibrio sifiae TaxID=566293 RepID=A0A2S7X2U8_9GAMM|nr:hypothetical protein BTO22_13635 [Aliivibrio sifiae]